MDKNYISSANGFGFAMLKKLTLQDPTKNVFISPASILFALSMVNDGAVGITEESIRSAMQLKGFTRDELNENNLQLARSLMLPDTSVELHVANSLWLNHPFELKPEFTKDCDQKYFAETFERDFSAGATLGELNGWVSKKTGGKIEKILDGFSPDAVLVILDAIYFHGKWTHPFDSSRTVKKPFYTLDGRERAYPRMVQSREYEYYEDPVLQTISIPYGNRFSMVISLPRERKGLAKMLEGLDKTTWSDWVARLRLREGMIGMPRFKMDYSASLVGLLKNLGMNIAFTGAADFSRMTNAIVYITDVVHKTYLDVNERGTEAAAVTSVFGTTSALHPAPPKPFVMIVDHPFFCAIRDNTTGLILFAGAIVDPKSE
jgi:serpin B